MKCNSCNRDAPAPLPGFSDLDAAQAAGWGIGGLPVMDGEKADTEDDNGPQYRIVVVCPNCDR